MGMQLDENIKSGKIGWHLEKAEAGNLWLWWDVEIFCYSAAAKSPVPDFTARKPTLS